MTKLNYELQTQAYSTFGDKLLQHTDRLNEIQNLRLFKPITIQLAPTENCDSACPFCSVAGRTIEQKIPYENIVKGLIAFKRLGAKAVEITGGGNPLIYKDASGDKVRTINDILSVCISLNLKIGIITNSENLVRWIQPQYAKNIEWIRISLIKLDEGKTVDDYNFEGFDLEKIGFSYIIYEKTTKESIEKIAQLVDKYPKIKFVRIAADCLTEESLRIKDNWGDIISTIDKYNKFFIKEINDNFLPYEKNCFVGMIRPYWVWNGIYICTSHVLKHRNYDEKWKLCDPQNIELAWNQMNERFKRGENPYNIDIKNDCWHCYYKNNNQILDSIIKELPDKDFV
jgi:hypothetical protein